MKILVCGAGVAGLATTTYLQRAGHDVSVLELAPEIRTAGGPVDVRGDSLDFMRELGLYEEMKSHELHMTEDIDFVDENDEWVADFPASSVVDCPDDIEIGRTHLMPILSGSLAPGTDVRFSTSVESLEDRGDHVHVRRTDGTEDDYDLVVGADGVHSRTRRLVFGPEKDFAHFLGIYVGFAPIGPPAPAGTPSKNFNMPGKLIACVQSNDVELCVMMFRSPQLEYDYRDPSAIRRIILDTYHEDLWRTQELVKRAVASPGLWMDECTQIKMSSWRKGRVVLVGDAAHCATPLSGRGVSLGISGGRFLSIALSEFPDDLDAAIARYDEMQRPYVDAAQQHAHGGMDMLIPPTAAAIEQRNAQLRQLAEA